MQLVGDVSVSMFVHPKGGNMSVCSLISNYSQKNETLRAASQNGLRYIEKSLLIHQMSTNIYLANDFQLLVLNK